MLLRDETGITEFAGLCVGATMKEPVADPWKSRIIELGQFGRDENTIRESRWAERGRTGPARRRTSRAPPGRPRGRRGTCARMAVLFLE